MPTVRIYTLGCKANQYDTQSIREKLISSGYREVRNDGKTQLCVINTCTVTSNADAKSLNLIRKAVKNNPKAQIIVTGCLAELDRDKILKIDNSIMLVRNSQKDTFLTIIQDKNRRPRIHQQKQMDKGITGFKGHTRAFLKIQDGCDNYCSYCKVALVRGKPRSKPLSAVLQEANSLVSRGFKEIVLTGICLGKYGNDLRERINLVDAIDGLEGISGLLRIRLSSIEAADVSDALIDKMAKSYKLCPHFHIPIQSGDDTILRKMNRKYTEKYYLELVKKIKRKINKVSLTTDCLVGFPGETKENFNNTLRVINKVEPLRVHVFPYSERKGTFAANNFRDKVSPLVIKERIEKLQRIAKDCTRNFILKFSKVYLPVLFESRSRELKGYWEGYSDNYIKFCIKSNKTLRNKILLLRPNLESCPYL